MASRKRKRAEQTEVPGTERVKIAAIDKAAKKFHGTEDEHRALTKSMRDQKATLISVFHDNVTNGNLQLVDGKVAYYCAPLDKDLIYTEKAGVKFRAPAAKGEPIEVPDDEPAGDEPPAG